MADVRDFWTIRIAPPLWYLTAIIIGVILDLIVGFDLGLPTIARIILAIVFVGLFGAFGPRAIRLFHRQGEDERPWTPTKELQTSGPYAISRNPMYVGLASLQIGVAAAANNGWILVLVPVALVAVYATAIRFEEAYLEAEFGEVYARYKASVRRWL